jgi:predicted GNAT superfamily acetyltransferase
MLLTFAKEGGVVLLMLDDGAPVGFAFGFPALSSDGQVKLASHQAGVLPQYRAQGWGQRLKLAQREAALAQGFTLMTWTYDPLQGLNARLNLHKLGAVCRTYLPNLYGDMDDILNKGLPSDRFKVDWWLASDHVAERSAGQFADAAGLLDSTPLLNPSQPGPDDLRLPPDAVTPAAASPAYLVETPDNLARLKQAQPEAALAWRLQTRQLFTHLFEAGYTATDLLRSPDRRNFYLLQQGWSPA